MGDVAPTPSKAPSRRGFFLTFEGMDGVGKTTQCDYVCNALELAGHEVVRLREPGGTRAGELVRSILLDTDAKLDPVCELLLYEAARAQLVSEVIRPALERGAFVVSDRFYDSTTAYQGFARGLGEDVARLANDVACSGTRPDLTVVLDLDAGEAWRRATAAGADRMEREGVGFQERVREGFSAIAAREPDRVLVVDGSGDEYRVWARVRDALARIAPLPEKPVRKPA